MLLFNKIIIALYFIGLFSSTGLAYTIKTDIAEGGIRNPGGHEKLTYNSIYRVNHSSSVLQALVDNESTITDATTNEDGLGLYVTHFFNPSTNMGLYGVFATAKEKAMSYYKLALKERSWKYLGHSLHLLQDMAVPSHANSIPHMYQATKKIGYEWWVARNWDAKVQPLVNFFFANSSFAEPIGPRASIDSLVFSMATATQASGYKLDYGYSDWLVDYEHGIYGDTHIEMSSDEAEYASHFLIPSAIRVGGGLFEKFCFDINCSEIYPLSDSSGPGGGHPDDNFDVSSRLIELEELDVTKQAWKDLYNRTGIKKGYNGLFLEKTVTAAYVKLSTTTSEADYSVAAQQFQNILARTQKEAKHSFEDTYYASADVALLSDAFVDNAAELLLKRLKEPIREVKETFNPVTLLKNQPVLLIPSGALTGFNDSPMVKASLDEYVKMGGTLIVFSQKHGYDYASIPTPDGKPISGYGWEEDQNCFADSVVIESWHQMFSGQLRFTPTVNVDGYFTGMPENATVLLRRTANGQPAMIMYEHGQGRVVVTSMYSDWAYGHGQASEEEIALVRDILAWAKKPVTLPEIKPGEAASLSVSFINSTATDAASIKIQLWNPDRTTLLLEQKEHFTISAGGSAVNIFNWLAAANSSLGIYHIDYVLYDSEDNVIQPQAETDSGRFAVSNPPLTGMAKRDIWLSITSPNQEVFLNEPFVYTFHIFNNTTSTRNLTLKAVLPHTGRTHEWSITATPNGETAITGSDVFTDSYFMFETLKANLYDESGNEIGSYMLSFKGVYPSINVTSTISKSFYAKGESAAVSVNLKNGRNVTSTVKLRMSVTDPSNTAIFSVLKDLTLDENGTVTALFNFPTSITAPVGAYTIATEVVDSGNVKVGGDAVSFEIMQSQIAVTSTLPTMLTAGTNTVTFNLINSGRITVNSGTLNVVLKDPDGLVATAVSSPFTLASAQATTIDVPITLPSLKFGSYTLAYSQNDETKNGKQTSVMLANTLVSTASLDKPTYQVRETANLAVNLANSGRFNLDNAVVTVTVPTAGYSDTKSITFAAGQVHALQYAIPLPATMTGGQHTATVTLALPGGATIVKNSMFTLPQSSLSLSLNQTAYTAGSIISPVLVNSGGVDTTVQYRLSLYDVKSMLITDKILIEPVSAGSSRVLVLPVPVGAVDGIYTLVMAYTDMNTSMPATVQKAITIAGVNASLAVQTNKPSYLTAESIAGLSTISNSGTTLNGGNFHLEVSTGPGSRKAQTWTTQADFQTGIRKGVDTYGVNDWVIPDDDFSATVIDVTKWNAEGNVTIQAERAVADASVSGSELHSRWQLEGDFDIQVDFNANNATTTQGAGLEIHSASASVYLKNDRTLGYSSSFTIGGSATGSKNTGAYANSGRLRFTRISTTVVAYYWNGTSWAEVNRGTYPQLAEPAAVSLSVWPVGIAAAGTTTAFDNFKVNTGRIKTENQTVDSVRLLPVNDNFDDGVLNRDRWDLSKNAAVDESAGVFHLSSSLNSIWHVLTNRVPLYGNFTAVSRYKNYSASPALSDWGAYHMLASDTKSGFYIVRHSNSQTYTGGETIRAASFVNTTEYLTGNIITPYASNSGLLRLRKEASTGYTDYFDGTNWVNVHSDNRMTASPLSVLLYTRTEETNPNCPTIKADVDYYYTNTGKYATSGTLNLKHDSGAANATWGKLLYTATQPVGTSIKFRTRTSETEAGLTTAAWSTNLTSTGSPITSPAARWIEIEATLATTNSNITPLLNDLTVTFDGPPDEIVWQSNQSLNLNQGAPVELNNAIGTLSAVGKLYLKGTLTSTTGQVIAAAEYPFYVAQGNLVMRLTTDKKLYKQGETVNITGEVVNLTAVDAVDLAFTLKRVSPGGAELNLTTEMFTIAAGGSHPFTLTTTAGTDGIVALAGNVTQNGMVLADIAERYEVASPQVAATLVAPDASGNEPFTMQLGLTNSGKTDAAIMIGTSFGSLPESVTIPAGETRIRQYQQQINSDAVYSVTLSGDLSQTIMKKVTYGLGGSVTVTPLAVYPEGKVTVPITIANSGLLDGLFTVNYQLAPPSAPVMEQTRSYYLPKGGNAADSLSYDLTEGTYQLTASGQLPAIAASAGIVVKKEVKADMLLLVAPQDGNLLPAAIKVTNLGFSPIAGSVRLSLVADGGAVIWNSDQEVSLPQLLTPVPQTLAFSINLSAINPGNYTIKAELIDAANRQLVRKDAPFTLLGPVFTITRVPSYQIIPAGGNATMTFTVRNNGNQEGAFSFSLKADDLIDTVRTEWLKAGEEKELVFTFKTSADLEEKDYTALYTLKGTGTQEALKEQGVVTYHLAGSKLAVVATLDRQNYSAGDTAVLTLTITQQDSNAAPSLFARTNYDSYNEKRSFILNSSQTLTFNVPLSRITGEKLFYGIYAESGRSIHLNTIYIHKADAALSVSTDKQVYNPGEIVTATLAGSATGELTLSGPAGFSTTLAYSGSTTRSFALPAIMTAGTYTIAAQLNTQTQEVITATHPFDVSGIQVKVKEALLDRPKYAATDTMNLALTIESNQNLASTVKTWVVDPAGSYSVAGSGDVNLTASAPLLATIGSQLSTGSLGIHKLVYGIYQGDLLLASGAKAFDIGEGVLLGLATDRTDYPDITMPVSVKTDYYGTATAGIEFFLDGTSIKTESLALNGLGSFEFTISPANVTPGAHTLKGVLTVAGLTSTRELRFAYGSNLPDLVSRIAAQPPVGGTVNLSLTIANQGKSAAGVNRVALYDGDPVNGGQLLTTLDVPAIVAGSSVSLPYAWNALGKSGDHILYAVVDSNNSIVEFIEGNNTTVTAVSLPVLSLALTSDKGSYTANEDALFTVNAANLTTNLTFDNTLLKLRLTSAAGTTIDLPDKSISGITPSIVTPLSVTWNTGVTVPSSYTVTARLVSGETELASVTGTVTIVPTSLLTGTVTMEKPELKQGGVVNINYLLTNRGNVAVSSMVRGSLMDPVTGSVVVSAEQNIAVPYGGDLSGTLALPSGGLGVQQYVVVLEQLNQDSTVNLAQTMVTILDGIPPVVNVLSPIQARTYLADVLFTVSGTDISSGIAQIEYQLDNGTWQQMELKDAAIGEYSALWSPVIADNGPHSVSFRGTDRGGNSTAPITVLFSVQHDTTPPNLVISTLPDGSYTRTDILNISGTVTDDAGIKELLLNGAALTFNTDGSFSSPLLLKPAANPIKIKAIDLAGNSTTDSRTIFQDLTVPALTINTPADNSKTATALVEVTGTVDETSTVQVKLGNNTQSAVMDGSAFAAAVVTMPGLNTIEITALDLAGNSSSQKRTVLFDDQKPTLEITEPPQDQRTNNSSVTISGIVSDPFTAVGVTMTMDGTMMTPTVINGHFSQTINLSEEKPYLITVTATNEVGMQTIAQRNVIYDRTPPVLTINPVASPTNSSVQSVSGTREEGRIVTVNCPTASVGEVEYPSTTTWRVALTGMQHGENRLQASTIDSAGNQTVVFTVILYIEKAPELTINARPNQLWPPNKKLVPVKITGNMVSNGSDIRTVSISVADEYGKYNLHGIHWGDTILLEAWREGNDRDGRVYTITVVAIDQSGRETTKSTTVVVPHDQGD